VIHAAVRFRRAGLDDEASDLARNVNGIAGLKCAKWLAPSVAKLPDARIDADPTPEDWGWAMAVNLGKDVFVLGCGRDPDNEKDGWQVLFGDNASRGFLPATRKRRTASLEALTDCVDAFLRSQADVFDIVVEKE
jgi:hypothetical protein